MPKRRPQALKPLPKSGTAESSLRVVGSFFRGPEHDCYYVAMDGLTLALALLPVSARRRFDRLFVEFKTDDNLGKGRMFNGMEDFIKRKPVTQIVPAPPKPRGGNNYHLDISG